MLNGPTMQKVVSYLHNDWPVGITDLELGQFYHQKKALVIVSDCLMLSNSVVVPDFRRIIVLH